MATYSPELLAALRQRYEETDQPMTAIAAEFGIGITTLQTLVRKNGWSPRSQRMRGCPPLRLLEEAQALPAGRQSRTGAEKAADSEVTLAPPLSLSGEGSQAVLEAAASPPMLESTPGFAGATNASALSPVERLEALVVKYLDAEEAVFAQLSVRPRARYEAERCARTLSVLAQTLKTLQGMRADAGTGGSAQDDDPRSIDEFREEFARRIRMFMENRIGSERMALDRQVARLTVDELRELVQVGRERGMQALLQPPEEQEEDDSD
jgi:hypothetical protein